MAEEGPRCPPRRCWPQEVEGYAQQRLLEAKKRGIVASTRRERERAEAWVQSWGRLVRGFFDPGSRAG